MLSAMRTILTLNLLLGFLVVTTRGPGREILGTIEQGGIQIRPVALIVMRRVDEGSGIEYIRDRSVFEHSVSIRIIRDKD